jgi:iron complex transport system substrate-binding protein
VLLTTFGAAGRAAQLRAAGITVFELGEVRGLATLGPTATALGALCGRPAEGRELVARLRARLARIALPLGDRPRRRALYAAPIGTQIYGGTRGTSYHDVLTSAGLVDVAAERFEGWPKYRAEDLLALAPPLVVTKPGGRAALCAHPGLAALPACARAEGILELPAALLDDPGLGMLDAAERLFEAAYPDVATPSAGPPAAR